MDWPPTWQTNMDDSQKRPYSQLATCHIARCLQHQYPPASSAARRALQIFASQGSCQDFLHHSAGLAIAAEPFPTVMSFSHINLASLYQTIAFQIAAPCKYCLLSCLSHIPVSLNLHPLFNNFSSVGYAQETRVILLRAFQREVAPKTEQRSADLLLTL